MENYFFQSFYGGTRHEQPDPFLEQRSQLFDLSVAGTFFPKSGLQAGNGIRNFPAIGVLFQQAPVHIQCLPNIALAFVQGRQRPGTGFG